MISSPEYLISDLKLFAENSRQQKPGVDCIVDRKQYFNLMERVDNLTKTNFESLDKYQMFLRYLNQPERKSDRLAFDRNFTEDKLFGDYLWMLDYIDRIANKLN